MAVTFTQNFLQKKAVVKITQNLQKNTCARIFILIMLEALGQEEFNGDFKILFIALETIWKLYLMSSVMCINSFSECLIYGDKKANKVTTKNIIFLEIFLKIHDFLDMPKYFSNQLIIMHK